jgi:hypothetical protein
MQFELLEDGIGFENFCIVSLFLLLIQILKASQVLKKSLKSLFCFSIFHFKKTLKHTIKSISEAQLTYIY